MLTSACGLIFGCAAHGRHGLNITVNGKNVNINAGSNEARDTVQKLFLASKVREVSAETPVGSIEVRAAPAGVDEIHVEATRIITGNDPIESLRTLLPSVAVTAELKDSTLRLSSTEPADFKGRNLQVAVNYVVTVPSRIGVKLNTSSGEIKLEGIHGDIEAESDYGAIHVHDAFGKIKLSGNSGAISVSDSPDSSSISANTKYGDIRLEHVGGALEAETASGAIHIADAVRAVSLKLHSDYGAISVTKAAGRIEATASSGAISIDGSHVSGNLKLHSAYGAVSATGIVATGKDLKVEISADSGAVTYSGDASELNLESNYGEVTGSLADRLPLKSANLHSSSGGVELTLTSTASATVQTVTSSGQVQVPGGIVCTNSNEDGTDKTVMLGSGAAKVKLSSDYGNVALRTQ